ncbi:MAG TPA: exodeoxyribonuclease VII small subunit [bacterium]|nr:exodeoxyribonuclease VII small subunit [bacterium]
MNKLNFENAMERLEEIADQLEDGSQSLDESLKLFAEANKLAAFCTGKLDEAGKKLKILIKDQDSYTLDDEETE